MGLDVHFSLRKRGAEETIVQSGNIRNYSYAVLQRFIPSFTEKENTFHRTISLGKFKGYLDKCEELARKMRDPRFVTLGRIKHPFLDRESYCFIPNAELMAEFNEIFPGIPTDRLEGWENFINHMVEALKPVDYQVFELESYQDDFNPEDYQVDFFGWR